MDVKNYIFVTIQDKKQSRVLKVINNILTQKTHNFITLNINQNNICCQDLINIL